MFRNTTLKQERCKFTLIEIIFSEHKRIFTNEPESLNVLQAAVRSSALCIDLMIIMLNLMFIKKASISHNVID